MYPFLTAFLSLQPHPSCVTEVLTWRMSNHQVPIEILYHPTVPLEVWYTVLISIGWLKVTATSALCRIVRMPSTILRLYFTTISFYWAVVWYRFEW